MFTLYATWGFLQFSKRKELVLHLVFEIKLLGGVESTLNTDELGVCMLHEVIYSFVMEIGVNSDVGSFDTIGCLIDPVLRELLLML
jgi:hypothetical protein